MQSHAPEFLAIRFKDYRRTGLRDSKTLRYLSLPTAFGPLLLEHEELHRFGSVSRRMVESDTVNMDESAIAILDGIHDPSSGVGQPDLIVDGQIAWRSHHLIASDANDPRVSYIASATRLQSPYDFNSLRHIGDSLHIDFKGGSEWAGVWLVAGTRVADRLSPDYSMYDTLVLELKGDVGGEKLVINMEDRDDPADGTSTRYRLQLSGQWQTYEIDLKEFETADLSILSVPLDFAFFEEPVSLSVRSARFVKKD